MKRTEAPRGVYKPRQDRDYCIWFSHAAYVIRCGQAFFSLKHLSSQAYWQPCQPIHLKKCPSPTSPSISHSILRLAHAYAERNPGPQRQPKPPRLQPLDRHRATWPRPKQPPVPMAPLLVINPRHKTWTKPLPKGPPDHPEIRCCVALALGQIPRGQTQEQPLIRPSGGILLIETQQRWIPNQGLEEKMTKGQLRWIDFTQKRDMTSHSGYWTAVNRSRSVLTRQKLFILPTCVGKL